MNVLYLVGAVVSWVLITGMVYHDLQSVSGGYPNADQREALGHALVVAGALAMVWPLGLPVAYCWTGFAKYGIWRQRANRLEP